MSPPEAPPRDNVCPPGPSGLPSASPLSRATRRQRWLAFVLARCNRRHEPLVADRKSALLKPLRGTVVEIGPGAGINLTYFHPDVRWTGVEPNPCLHPVLRNRAQALGRQIELIPGSADHIPLPDASADAVVATLVLCSVPDVDAALREIRRVLKPGGRFVFLEHVAAPAGTWLRRVQNWGTPITRVLGDGCNLNRETEGAIRHSGFSQVDCTAFRLPLLAAGPQIAGSAVR